MSDSSDRHADENTEGFIRYFFFWLVWVLVVYYCIRSLRFMANRFGGRGSDDDVDDYELTGANAQNSEGSLIRSRSLHGNNGSFMTRQMKRKLIKDALVMNSRAHGTDIARRGEDGSGVNGTATDANDFIDNTCIICLNDYDEDPSGYDEENQANDHNACRVVHSKYCSHIFHTNCLVDWVEKKNECPCCRIPMLRNTDIEQARAMQRINST
eukprot:CAMPEP_0116018520 /NCGR_PEP_ID=MMETSP0321-20121206/8695_1 /TAXON_ID=163516 /ORGANISM="Leptocylindrus danicus var. danicus, Strain B650" /LENGTH=211 /DNA_ID=CAMNT_0003488925 /DNA_START=213 /DNA_END=848 /DNA_ORIENTATION=-